MDSSLIRSYRPEPEPYTGQISVAVIGGGIGGLAAALSLLRAGLDVHVYEQAGEMREAGAGIQVSPNATRILNRLGLAKRWQRWACGR
jgi:salicylate hydroxylase